MTVAETHCDNFVLVVEDDRDVREAILEVLEDNAYRAVAASNGQEGLETLRAAAGKPCLILLDLMMPVMDGWGFRAAQKGDTELGSIPVVVLTAHASAPQTAQDMEAAGFLKKPVRLDALLDTVQRYCGRPS
ncbi:MAG TPA: response regulator [Haliangium sp.]|nr:response regulator [Haliangium sp.]